MLQGLTLHRECSVLGNVRCCKDEGTRECLVLDNIRYYKDGTAMGMYVLVLEVADDYKPLQGLYKLPQERRHTRNVEC